MNTKELKKALHDRNPTTINIVGNESLLVKEALSIIKSYYIEPGFEEFDYVYITDESAEEISILVQEVPLSRMKLIVCPEKASMYLRNKPDTTCLVSLDNDIRGAEFEVDCRKLWGRNLTNYIKSRTKELGLNFDASDVHKFMTFVGNDLSSINNELFKLSFLPNKNRSTIELLEEGNINSKLDNFLVSFANKDSSLALQTLYDMESFGTPQVKVFGFIVYVLKTMLSNLFLDEESPEADRRYIKYKSKFDFFILSKLLCCLETIDLSIKMNAMDLAIPLKYLIERNFSEFDSFLAKVHEDFV